MDEYLEWYASDANKSVDKKTRKATVDAYKNGDLTLDQIKGGSIWKGKKADQMVSGKLKRLNDDYTVYQAAKAHKNQAEKNIQAAKDNKPAGNPQPSKNDPKDNSKDDNKEQGPKQDAASASKDVQDILADASNYADTKPTAKVSPFFWTNIDYMLEDAKAKAMKEEDPTKRQELLKKLKAQKAGLYADHILKSLANLAYSTANWTGAEAGHNPELGMAVSQADLYKRAQNQAYADQIKKIKDYDITQQINRTEAVNEKYNKLLADSARAKWTELANDARFKDAKGNLDYYKMFDSLDVDTQQLLKNYLKSELANIREGDTMEDVAKKFGANELGPIALDLFKGAVDISEKGIQGGYNWLKNKLGL